MRPALIESLLDPSRYPHPVGRVELIETHISWVLLAGAFVYKIKKPVDFGFLDFSTLERRRFFCDEELRLNRRTAPGLYLDTVVISGSETSPKFGDDGPVLEYAVRMKRFDPDSTFDRLLADDRLPDTAIHGLARELAALHRVAALAPADGRFGTHAEVAGPMRDNFTDLERLLTGTGLAAALPALRSWTERQLAGLAPVIANRLRDGFVCECHGDAHLGNVAWIEGHATLFDCIEFSEDLRWTDVMADLAFTVMDLRDHGADRLGWLLLDEYLAETGDYDGLQLLPLYIVYRAMVRAKIHALRLEQPGADHDEAEHAIGDYLALADRAAREHRPAIILTMGVSGSGKSWLARHLVEQVGMIRLRSDVERKRLSGLHRDDKSSSPLEGGLYTAEATEATYARLAEAAQSAVAAGFPVLIDATFLRRGQRDRFLALADRLEVPLRILHTEAEETVLQARIRDRAVSGTDPSEADLEVLAMQQASTDPIAGNEADRVLVVHTDRPDPVAAAKDGLRDLF